MRDNKLYKSIVIKNGLNIELANLHPMDNFQIDMHTSRLTGIKYNSFFGAHGSLPLAFTDRILYNSQNDYVFDFFNRIFVDFLLQNELVYYNIIHSYIELFKFNKKYKYSHIKVVEINRKYNSLSVSKLNNMILGKISPVFKKNNVKPLGKIGMILK